MFLTNRCSPTKIQFIVVTTTTQLEHAMLQYQDTGAVCGRCGGTYRLTSEARACHCASSP